MKVFGFKTYEVTGKWGRLHNEKLYGLYSPNIIWVIKNRNELSGVRGGH